jgi:pterin-4a-carbinolamine dehydratase
MFGNFISRKSGQKCCVYGQNGKPLIKETIDKFLNSMERNTEKDLENAHNLSQFEISRKRINWEPKDDYSKLFRIFYFRNVFLLTDFIREIYNQDYVSNVHQIPNISVSNQEVFKIELYTPALKGLSYRDLQLATAINSIDFNKYKLVPLKSEDNHKKEIRMISIEDEKIKSSVNISEKSRFKNKYDALAYENSVNSIEEPKGCSNPEGCACKQTNKVKYE